MQPTNLPQKNIDYTKAQIHSKLSNLKADYAIVKRLINLSGFGWDSVLRVLTAEGHVWMEYIDSHPEAARFRTAPFPFFNQLHELYDGNIATNEYAVSSASSTSWTIAPAVKPVGDVGTQDNGALVAVGAGSTAATTTTARLSSPPGGPLRNVSRSMDLVGCQPIACNVRKGC